MNQEEILKKTNDLGLTTTPEIINQISDMVSKIAVNTMLSAGEVEALTNIMHYDLMPSKTNSEIYFPYQNLSIIELGIDIFLPTTLTISLHTTSLTPSIAFIFSRKSRIEALSLRIVSTLRSIVCSPMLLPI